LSLKMKRAKSSDDLNYLNRSKENQ
jgi:hypothetical protein